MRPTFSFAFVSKGPPLYLCPGHQKGLTRLCTPHTTHHTPHTTHHTPHTTHHTPHTTHHTPHTTHHTPFMPFHRAVGYLGVILYYNNTTCCPLFRCSIFFSEMYTYSLVELLLKPQLVCSLLSVAPLSPPLTHSLTQYLSPSLSLALSLSLSRSLSLTPLSLSPSLSKPYLYHPPHSICLNRNRIVYSLLRTALERVT